MDSIGVHRSDPQSGIGNPAVRGPRRAGSAIPNAPAGAGFLIFHLVHADSPLVANVLYEPRRFPVGVAGNKMKSGLAFASPYSFSARCVH